jgi:uncharacterized protein (DUF1499 family)
MRRLAILAGAFAIIAAGVLMTGRGSEFGFWQAAGLATGTPDDLRPIDFATLERRSSPNDALICPKDICPKARPDAEPPDFKMSLDRLREKLRAVALAEPRTVELFTSDPDRLRFVQRSFLMRYPDVVDALLSARGDDASTLALYSRSAVGRSDLGVNRARLERWMEALAR